MNRQLLYLLLVLVLIVAASPLFLRLSQTERFGLPAGGLSRTSPSETEGFAPPRVAPFSLDPPRPAEPRSILVSEPSIHEPFQGVSPSTQPVIAVSDTAYDAMSLKQRSDVLKDIQQLVREEIRAARTQPLLDSPASASPSLASASPASASASPALASASPSVQQGRDYQRRCEKDQESEGDDYRCPKNPDGSCPPVPDLSQYIRKDQIPCWGCAITY